LNIARVLGSVIGGTLVAVVGTPACFLINAASFGAVIISLAMMRTEDIATPVRAERARGQIREGFRYAIHTPELAAPLLMLTVGSRAGDATPTDRLQRW
jgi:hypothetical protein